MKLQVYRTSVSNYQNSQFLAKEQKILEEIEGVRYVQSLSDIDQDIPFVLITNSNTRPNDIARNLLDKTVLMIHPNSGHDNIDFNFFNSVGFPIILGNPIRANAVSEYILSCIMHHTTAIPHHLHWSQDRTWDRKLLRDQKVLIIGYGHIGKLTYEILSPMCREVSAYDPCVDFSQLKKKGTHRWDDKIFEDVNILIIAANLNPTSKGLINSQQLNKLAPNNIIINAARGEIITEEDLVQYLQRNPKSFCYLDVFQSEPFKPGYLHDLKNLNKTSHIAGVHQRLNQDIISFEYLIINDFINYFEKDKVKEFTSEYDECLLTKEMFVNYEK